MKIYIVVRRVENCKQNVVVTSSRKVAEHLMMKFSFMDSYEVEEHDLVGYKMMEDK